MTSPLRDAESATAGVPVVDHERIWLEPKCADDNPKYDEGRTWCQHDIYETCPDCGTKATEYVRADLHASTLSELDTARAANEALMAERTSLIETKREQLAQAQSALTAAQARIAELEGVLASAKNFITECYEPSDDRDFALMQRIDATLSPVKENDRG